MKKVLVISMLVLLMFMLTGCDENNNEDLFIREYKHYINNTQHWKISTYNGYHLVDRILRQEEDGDYTLVMRFKKFE